MCVCDIKSEHQQKNVPDVSKLDAFLHETRIKVLRLDLCTSMISFNKVEHQMWHHHSFYLKEIRQQNEQWWWRLEATDKGGGQNFKRGGGRVFDCSNN